MTITLRSPPAAMLWRLAVVDPRVPKVVGRQRHVVAGFHWRVAAGARGRLKAPPACTGECQRKMRGSGSQRRPSGGHRRSERRQQVSVVE